MVFPIGLFATNTWRRLISNHQPIAWWTFDEASGAILDQSGNGHNLSAQATIVRQQTPAISGSGYAIGTGSDFATRADAVPLRLVGVDMTLICWVKCVSTVTSRTFLYGDSHWFLGTSGLGEFNYHIPNVNFVTASTYVLTPDTWQMIAVTRVGQLHTLYVNGASVYSVTSAVVPSNVSGGIFVGSDHADLMDDVAIFNKPLTAAQIAELYAAPGA